MDTFDSTKTKLFDILREVSEGKIQLPDFQRGWIWDSDHIKGLLASIAKSYPIGAIMLLETGNEDLRFKTRPIESVKLDGNIVPEKLILDGQQRITSLYQAIITNQVVNTTNEKGNMINRWYYIDMKKAIDNDFDLEEAIISVNEDRIRTEDRTKNVTLDLSKPEYEYHNLYYPVSKVDEYTEWRRGFNQYWNHDPEKTKFWDDFETKVINSFNNYLLPIIIMKKINTKEAICQVFEKVNTGGVSLNVFELLTATYAADDFGLREDWKRREFSLKRFKVLGNLKNTDFIEAVTLLNSYQNQLNQIKKGVPAHELSAIACKRKDMLNLTLSSYQKYANLIEEGFILVAKLLAEQGVYDYDDISYSTQLIPLAALSAALENKPLPLPAKEKVMRWYWCGVLGELYGGSVATRIALDLPQLIEYCFNNGPEPRSIFDAHFNMDRLHTLKTRNSAAYKGIYTLLLKSGAMDFITGTNIDHISYFSDAIDIHHIFPEDWCKANNIPERDYNCIINKTALSDRSNRIIGGAAPSKYLATIGKKYEISELQLKQIIASHLIDAEAMFADDFYRFFELRKKALLHLIGKTMGKG